MSNAQGAVSDLTSKSASRATLIKLCIFTVSLALFPLTSFFVSKNWIWDGNATYAAITAIFVANGVLVTYIISAVLEDREQKAVQPPESKKKR